jgi:signal transduction histidine kinase
MRMGMNTGRTDPSQSENLHVSAEAALSVARAERQRLYDVLEALPVYVVLLSPDYHVPFANRFFRQRFGESGGKRCFEYLFHRAEPCENCETFKVLKTHAPHHWEWTGPDGRDYDIHDYPFADTDGSPLILEMGTDVTERKRAEEALRRSHEDLQEQARQLRELAGELTRVEQRERQRLAQVLHDHLQQLLVGAKFQMLPLLRAGDGRQRRSAAGVDDLLTQSIQVSRDLTGELSPPVLHEGGLAAALEWLVLWMRQKHGLSVRLRAEGAPEPASEDLRVLLFRAARELLFNVSKHAGVRKAVVRLSARDGRIELEVADRGKGFDPQALRQGRRTSGGFGLSSIRQRLELLGGSFQVASAPGAGSRFTLAAPSGAAYLTQSGPPEDLVATIRRPDRRAGRPKKERRRERGEGRKKKKRTTTDYTD